eukprot:7381993-Prymnesium_polylepis.1
MLEQQLRQRQRLASAGIHQRCIAVFVRQVNRRFVLKEQLRDRQGVDAHVPTARCYQGAFTLVCFRLVAEVDRRVAIKQQLHNKCISRSSSSNQCSSSAILGIDCCA